MAEHSLFVSEDYEDSHSTQLTPERALVVLQHAARAMAYLHSFEPPILHRDLKTHNLLVGDGWVVKIADFGLSRAVSAQTMTAAGTPQVWRIPFLVKIVCQFPRVSLLPCVPLLTRWQWSAPEVIRQDRYTEKADVFSFGVCNETAEGCGAVVTKHADGDTDCCVRAAHGTHSLPEHACDDCRPRCGL